MRLTPQVHKLGPLGKEINYTKKWQFPWKANFWVLLLRLHPDVPLLHSRKQTTKNTALTQAPILNISF